MTAAVINWMLHSIDISAAFLQGNLIKRKLYMRPPKDVCSAEFVWLLKRCIYGLNDASRSCYDKVVEVLLNLGGTLSTYDKALFLWYDQQGNLIGILVCHVDDFVCAGTNSFHQNVISQLKKLLLISVHNQGTFKYLGMNVQQFARQIKVDQELYIPSISRVNIQDKKGQL